MGNRCIDGSRESGVAERVRVTAGQEGVAESQMKRELVE